MVLNSKEIALKVYEDLLSKNREKQINTIKENFALQSEFVDPLVTTRNAEETLAQFFLLSYFSRVKGIPNTVLQTIQNGKDIVVIDGIQEYGITSLKFLSISLRVITKFEFLDGKIVKHEDIWSVSDLLTRIPIFGGLYNLWRTVFATAGAVFHQAIRGGQKWPQ